jgi:ubiquinone/menaquinone biosynthesis C-methylase UbiE/intracellular sulfur oxidation DsrE/DsrF family protein
VTRRLSAATTLALLLTALAAGQEKSVRPGINDPFRNPDVKKYEGTFEGESREVFAKRKEIVAAVGLKPGMVVADVGAGTGLFTRLFAADVGPAGKVYAVDIAEKFLAHVAKTAEAAGLKNVTTVLCKPDSAGLPAGSADVAFVCDTYHHFEFPHKTMASIHAALKPGGRVVLVDFKRVMGQSSDWVMNHVRAGQAEVESEVREAGFRKAAEVKDLLQDNYLIVLEKVEAKDPRAVYPVIEGYGGVVPLPDAAEPPAKGSKVVFDVTAAATDPGRPAPGLERVATLLNLAGAAGLKAADLDVVVVLHGDATLAALTDGAFRAKAGRPPESAVLLDRLTTAGVRVLVCGQSLERKGLARAAVRPGVTVAASAVSAVVNLQAKGFAYVPAHGP